MQHLAAPRTRGTLVASSTMRRPRGRRRDAPGRRARPSETSTAASPGRSAPGPARPAVPAGDSGAPVPRHVGADRPRRLSWAASRPSAPSPMVPLTMTRSPAAAPARLSAIPDGTVPNSVAPSVSMPGVDTVSPPIRSIPNSRLVPGQALGEVRQARRRRFRGAAPGSACRRRRLRAHGGQVRQADAQQLGRQIRPAGRLRGNARRRPACPW